LFGEWRRLVFGKAFLTRVWIIFLIIQWDSKNISRAFFQGVSSNDFLQYNLLFKSTYPHIENSMENKKRKSIFSNPMNRKKKIQEILGN
jgi:hypothetical protein